MSAIMTSLSPWFRFVLGGIAALLIVGALAIGRSTAVSRDPVVFVGSLNDYLPPEISTSPANPRGFLKRRLARRLAEAAGFQRIANPALNPSQLERHAPEMRIARREFLRETRLLREPPASRSERLRPLLAWFLGGVVLWAMLGHHAWQRLGPLRAGALAMICVCGALALLSRHLEPWFERQETLRIQSEFEARYLAQPDYVDDWTWTLVTLWADQEISVTPELAASHGAADTVSILSHGYGVGQREEESANTGDGLGSAIGWGLFGALAVACGCAGNNWLRNRLWRAYPCPATQVITAALPALPLFLAGWLAAGELSTWPVCHTWLPDPPKPPQIASNIATTESSSNAKCLVPAPQLPAPSEPAVAERRRDPAYVRELQAARDKEQFAFRAYLDGQRVQSLTRAHHSLAESRTSYELAAKAAEDRALRHLADAKAWRTDASAIRRNGNARGSSEGQWSTSQRQTQLARQAEEQRSAASRLRSQASGKLNTVERKRLESRADELESQTQKLESDARWSLSTGYQSNRGADLAERQAAELVTRARRAEAEAENERREAESNRAQARRCAAELAQLDREIASLRATHSSSAIGR